MPENMTFSVSGSVDCDRVIKLDCIGHVPKQLGKVLYELKELHLN